MDFLQLQLSSVAYENSHRSDWSGSVYIFQCFKPIELILNYRKRIRCYPRQQKSRSERKKKQRYHLYTYINYVRR